jgi:hypothetical protein
MLPKTLPETFTPLNTTFIANICPKKLLEVRIDPALTQIFSTPIITNLTFRDERNFKPHE